jgi:F-type H+-transporting ATPase subunit b
MDFLDERFLLAISFIIFLYLTYKPIKKAIISSLDKKIEEIQKELLEAEALKKDAIVLLKETEDKIAGLDNFKESMIQDAKMESGQLIKKKEEELELFLKHKKEESLQFITNQKQKTFNKEKSDFVQLVVELIEEYFKSSNNASMSDIEIVKKIRKN